MGSAEQSPASCLLRRRSRSHTRGIVVPLLADERLHFPTAPLARCLVDFPRCGINTEQNHCPVLLFQAASNVADVVRDPGRARALVLQERVVGVEFERLVERLLSRHDHTECQLTFAQPQQRLGLRVGALHRRGREQVFERE